MIYFTIKDSFLKNAFYKGSFQKAILQSGTAMSPWAFTSEPLKHAFDLAHFLGYEGDSADRRSLLEFFLKVPARELLVNYYKTFPKVSRRPTRKKSPPT